MSVAGRAAFLAHRAYAHRGLHHEGGPIENSMPAFSAALAAGYGIECDVRLSRDGIAFVFHDAELDRLTDTTGPVATRTAVELDAIALKGGNGGIPRLSALLSLVGMRVPVLIELKIDAVREIAPLCRAVLGDLSEHPSQAVIMSFHPGVGAWFAHNASHIVRGLVMSEENARGWAASLRRRLDIAGAKPDFLAYDIRSLPSTNATLFRAMGHPVLSWTVCTAQDRARATQHADAIIFEGAASDG